MCNLQRELKYESIVFWMAKNEVTNTAVYYGRGTNKTTVGVSSVRQEEDQNGRGMLGTRRQNFQTTWNKLHSVIITLAQTAHMCTEWTQVSLVKGIVGLTHIWMDLPRLRLSGAGLGTGRSV